MKKKKNGKVFAVNFHYFTTNVFGSIFADGRSAGCESECLKNDTEWHMK